jgi:acetone carboxylase gamma subunit
MRRFTLKTSSSSDNNPKKRAKFEGDKYTEIEDANPHFKLARRRLNVVLAIIVYINDDLPYREKVAEPSCTIPCDGFDYELNYHWREIWPEEDKPPFEDFHSDIMQAHEDSEGNLVPEEMLENDLATNPQFFEKLAAGALAYISQLAQDYPHINIAKVCKFSDDRPIDEVVGEDPELLMVLAAVRMNKEKPATDVDSSMGHSEVSDEEKIDEDSEIEIEDSDEDISEKYSDLEDSNPHVRLIRTRLTIALAIIAELNQRQPFDPAIVQPNFTIKCQGNSSYELEAKWHDWFNVENSTAEDPDEALDDFYAVVNDNHSITESCLEASIYRACIEEDQDFPRRLAEGALRYVYHLAKANQKITLDATTTADQRVVDCATKHDIELAAALKPILLHRETKEKKSASHRIAEYKAHKAAKPKPSPLRNVETAVSHVVEVNNIDDEIEGNSYPR